MSLKVGKSLRGKAAVEDYDALVKYLPCDRI